MSTSWGEAKFRDIPFFVGTIERGGGRRGVTHEYARSGKAEPLPFREDLGLKVRSFPIEGYVIGDNYRSARDKLIDALEALGPGELAHPTYGTLRVAVLSFRVRESVDELRLARFSVEFEETPVKPAQPTAINDAVSKLKSAADLAKTAIGADFLARYSPGRFILSLASNVQEGIQAIRTAISKVKMEEQQAALVTRSLTSLYNQASDLVSEPDDLLSALVDIFDLLDSRGALVEIYSFDPGTRPSGSTDSGTEEQTNFDLIQWLYQRLAVARACELISDEVFTSFDEAVDARDALTELIDEQAETSSDDTFPDMMQLRADLVSAVPGFESDLASLITVTPMNTIPSLVLSHQLYGDLDKEEDLVARNNLKHPGFVPGGRELEVLSDV